MSVSTSGCTAHLTSERHEDGDIALWGDVADGERRREGDVGQCEVLLAGNLAPMTTPDSRQLAPMLFLETARSASAPRMCTK